MVGFLIVWKMLHYFWIIYSLLISKKVHQVVYVAEQINDTFPKEDSEEN